MLGNRLLLTDSYKLGHWSMYPRGTTGVYSYFESRAGAKFDSTLFFGLRPILREKLAGEFVTREMIDEASRLAGIHFGTDQVFNKRGWEHILVEHGGRLPVIIKAVPEGTRVPTGNVLMTVENTDPEVPWVTNYVESLLTHVWYPGTVATKSRAVKDMLLEFLELNGDPAGVDFMLHDFGYRGASTDEAAAIGGAAHLVNFMGTDTLIGMAAAVDFYGADLDSLAFSVPATEHSVMTALGPDGEFDVLDDMLTQFPGGILSVVADSFDIYAFVDEVVRRKDDVLKRDGKLVVRPDSITEIHPTPESLVVDLAERLWDGFGGEINEKGFRVLDSHVGLLWGDGIDIDGIVEIVAALHRYGFAANNIVFGMGGGLLQKVNRDTQRFAFKCSAQRRRDGIWVDVQKNPLDKSKASKAGRLKLIRHDDGLLDTVREDDEAFADSEDVLVTVFENGYTSGLIGTKRDYADFGEIRSRSNLPLVG